MKPEHDLTLNPGTIYIRGTRALYPNVVAPYDPEHDLALSPGTIYIPGTRALNPSGVAPSGHHHVSAEPWPYLHPWHYLHPDLQT